MNLKHLYIPAAAVCLLLLLSHLPFLEADADPRMATGSRGAWIDEGLYSAQLRNALNGGSFEVSSADTFLKTPLLSGTLALPMAVFGTTMSVGRLTLVLTLLLAIPIFIRLTQRRSMALWLLPAMLFLPVHQHSHIALAEMFVCSLMLLGCGVASAISEHPRTKVAVLCGLVILTVLYKIQFAYLLPLPVLLLLLLPGSKLKLRIRRSAMAFGVIAGFVVLSLLLWYLPFSENWEAVAGVQSGSLSPENLNWSYFKRNLTERFWLSWQRAFTIGFLLSLPVGLFFLRSRQTPVAVRSMLLFTLLWLLLETHKLPMFYLPVRYVVSSYFAMGLWLALVTDALVRTPRVRILRFCAVSLSSILTLIHLVVLYDAFTRRAFSLRDANLALAEQTTSNDRMIGPWAPNLNWVNKAYAVPVWNDFNGSPSVLQETGATVIVTEWDEEDSNQAYRLNGIDLQQFERVGGSFEIALWTLDCYRIAPPQSD